MSFNIIVRDKRRTIRITNIKPQYVAIFFINLNDISSHQKYRATRRNAARRASTGYRVVWRRTSAARPGMVPTRRTRSAVNGATRSWNSCAKCCASTAPTGRRCRSRYPARRTTSARITTWPIGRSSASTRSSPSITSRSARRGGHVSPTRRRAAAVPVAVMNWLWVLLPVSRHPCIIKILVNPPPQSYILQILSRLLFFLWYRFIIIYTMRRRTFFLNAGSQMPVVYYVFFQFIIFCLISLHGHTLL